MKGQQTHNLKMLQWSFREIKEGQLWPVALALVLIIASVFALSALANRLEQVVVTQGKQALTADSVFVSSNPLPQDLTTLTQQRSLDTSNYTRFSTMAFSDQGMQLVMVKAIESNYPLQGEMVLVGDEGAQSNIKPGELWLDERLFAQLNTEVGQTLSIGNADFTVSGRIAEEPGMSFNPFQQMPTVFIHQQDVDKTGAIQMGSRVQYRLFINGDAAAIDALKSEIELQPSDRWRDENSGSRTNEVFTQTQQYLSLSVAIVVLMAATTLVLTCQHYVSTRRTTIAMLKSLGATKHWLQRWLVTQVALLFVTSAVVGSLIGVGLEFLLRIPLVDLLPDPLPSYGIYPFVLAIGTSVVIALPALSIPLMGLLNVSAANVMQTQQVTGSSKKPLWLIALPIAALGFAYGDNQMVWMVLFGVVTLFAVLAVCGVLINRLLAKAPVGVSMKLALSRINRSPVATGFQFGALGLSLMLIATIWLIRTDLLSDWQQTLPENAPNAFALNIADYEQQQYLNVLDENNIERSEAFPIIRGRLTKVNDEPAKQVDVAEEKTDALRRELNFTWADTLPKYNETLEGNWTQTNGVSVESEVAQALGLKIGDKLEFSIASQTYTAEVNTIRAVEWREMKPNFYFIFTPDVLANFPASYLVSFRLDDTHNDLISKLSRDFPTVSLMDIRRMGDKIRDLLANIVLSITVLAGLSGVAGLLLIFTLLRLNLSQRQQEVRLYRTLGASRKRISTTIWAEYGIMALTASLVASLGAEIVVASIMKFGFELDPQIHIWLWLLLPVVAFCTLFLVVNSLINKLLTPINKAFS
ncbi:ABC transporter permease [Vibrio paucivorans]